VTRWTTTEVQALLAELLPGVRTGTYRPYAAGETTRIAAWPASGAALHVWGVLAEGADPAAWNDADIEQVRVTVAADAAVGPAEDCAEDEEPGPSVAEALRDALRAAGWGEEA
jgi:hypothetical protein